MTPQALRALRLNLYFPPWRDVAAHLAAIPPDARRCTTTGWPHRDAWLQVRVDHDLAPGLLERMSHLDLPELRAHLARSAEARPLVEPPVRVALVDAGPPERWEIRVDRLEIALPSFVRWTLRVDGDPPHTDELRELLGERGAAEAWRLLRDHEGLDVVELVRGELGPIVHGEGGPWTSAVLSRATRGPGPVRIDDPLARDLPVPGPAQRFSLSRQRKWSAASDDTKDLKRWLADRGSRNLVYTT